jgi:hypothetical protein
MGILSFALLRVPYSPHPEERAFLERAEVQHTDEFVVSVAVPDDRESARFFGVPLARRGIQPVWLRVKNQGTQPCRLRLASLDPNYYPPLEAAYANHFHFTKRIIAFGLLAWLLLPVIILLPFKLLSAWSANRRMNAFFQKHGTGSGLIRPGRLLEGFAFTTHDAGTKSITVRLMGPRGVKEFSFLVAIPGLRLDHGSVGLAALQGATEAVECDEAELRKRLAALPRCTTNRRGTVEGDPLNLVVIGDFETILHGLSGRWDETEAIGVRSCWRMSRAFLLGTEYRYSPVSSLYVLGRRQDFALQKARRTINQRLHLRLWITPLQFQGKRVWIGQISRDIGVRFTLKTWNLTTHKIDPDVDDARDYVLDDLMEAGRVSQVAYVTGAPPCEEAGARHNLTGDPYFTDGLRVVAVFSETRTPAVLLDWVSS